MFLFQNHSFSMPFPLPRTTFLYAWFHASLVLWNSTQTPTLATPMTLSSPHTPLSCNLWTSILAPSLAVSSLLSLFFNLVLWGCSQAGKSLGINNWWKNNHRLDLPGQQTIIYWFYSILYHAVEIIGQLTIKRLVFKIRGHKIKHPIGGWKGKASKLQAYLPQWRIPFHSALRQTRTFQELLMCLYLALCSCWEIHEENGFHQICHNSGSHPTYPFFSPIFQSLERKGRGLKSQHLMLMPFKKSAFLLTCYHWNWQADPGLDWDIGFTPWGILPPSS